MIWRMELHFMVDIFFFLHPLLHDVKMKKPCEKNIFYTFNYCIIIMQWCGVNSEHLNSWIFILVLIYHLVDSIDFHFHFSQLQIWLAFFLSSRFVPFIIIIKHSSLFAVAARYHCYIDFVNIMEMSDDLRLNI